MGSDGRRWTNEELFKLARIEVDIPNTMDSEWKIDIKKSSVFPPIGLRNNLQRVAVDIRARARQRMTEREKRHTTTKEDGPPVWLEKRINNQSSFFLNRKHPSIFRLLKESSAESRKENEKLLELIEKQVPIKWEFFTK